MRNSMTVRVATFALAGALSVGALVGCGGKTEATDATTAQESAPAEQPADEAKTADAAAASQADSFDVGAFTFELPATWQGKVDVEVQAEGDAPQAIVHLPGNPDAVLATLTYYTDGAEPMAAGDIGSHLAGHVPGEGVRVEVWTKNWPWLAATGSTPSGVSEDELRTLVDLSTGGALSYDEVAGAGEGATGTQEPDFAKAELVSTVTIK